MNTQSNFFTSNADDRVINNAYTRTAGVVVGAVVVGAVVVGAAAFYGYKALKGSGAAIIPALGNAAASTAQVVGATATSAADLTHALVATL